VRVTSNERGNWNSRGGAGCAKRGSLVFFLGGSFLEESFCRLAAAAVKAAAVKAAAVKAAVAAVCKR